MRKRIFSTLAMLTFGIAVMASEVAGLTVEYVDAGTSAYVQAISAIGRIEFTEGKAVIVFKDKSAGTEELGALSTIKRISFGNVDENDITRDESESGTPTAVGAERTVSVSVYPNPTADHVHVDGLAEGQQVRLFSADGKLEMVTTKADIDLSGMPNGIYLLQTGKNVIRVIKK